MSEIRICKYCGMELSEGIPHGLRECHLRSVARIAELEAETKAAKENSQWLARLTESSRKENEHLRQTLSVYAAKQRWISVSERLPEKQKLTIGFTDNSAYVFFEIVNDDEMGLVMYPYQNRKGNVTHWMPLPESPNDTQTQAIVYGKESD